MIVHEDFDKGRECRPRKMCQLEEAVGLGLSQEGKQIEMGSETHLLEVGVRGGIFHIRTKAFDEPFESLPSNIPDTNMQ